MSPVNKSPPPSPLAGAKRTQSVLSPPSTPAPPQAKQKTSEPAAAPTAAENATAARAKRANARAALRIDTGTKASAPSGSVKSAAQPYQTQNPKEAGKQSIDLGQGPVTAGKPRFSDPGYQMSTQAKNYGDQKVGNKYSHMNEAIEQSGASGQEAAAAVLDPAKAKDLPPKAQNAVAKLSAAGNISEEQRVPGAGKTFRAAMSQVAAGESSMGEAITGSNPKFPAALTADHQRAAMGLPTKSKKVQAEFDPNTAGYMSDSSSDEGGGKKNTTAS